MRHRTKFREDWSNRSGDMADFRFFKMAAATTCVFSRVRPDHPRCRSATWIRMCRHTRDLIIYSKFHRNPFRGFGAPGGQNLAIPLLWLFAFTTACTTVQAVMDCGLHPHLGLPIVCTQSDPLLQKTPISTNFA